MDLIGRGERTAETAQNVSESDVIYRNDAVMEIANHLGMPAENWIKIAEEWLRDVPSAQPEIIRCKECKYWKDSDGVYRRGFDAESKCPLNLKKVYEGTFYCGMAERRQDG